MDKRTIIVIVVSLLVLILWNHYVIRPGVEEEQRRAREEQERLETAAAVPAAATPAETPAAAGPGPGTASAVASPVPAAALTAGAEPSTAPVGAEVEETLVVETDLYRVELTNRGARVRSWLLKAFRGNDGKPLELVAADPARAGRLPLELLYKDPETSERINSALFQVERPASPDPQLAGRMPESPAGQGIRMVFADGQGLRVEKEFLFSGQAYRGALRCVVLDQGEERQFELLLGPGFANPAPEEAKNRYYFAGQAVLDPAPQGGRLNRVGRDRVAAVDEDSGHLVGFFRRRVPFTRDGDALQLLEPVRWAGLESNYFLFALVPAAPTSMAVIRPVRTDPAGGAAGTPKGQPNADLFLALALSAGSGQSLFDFYVGPKEDAALKQGGMDPGQVIDFGFFSIIARPLLWMLNWIEGGVGNYGFAIILLTLIIKILFIPLTHKQMQSMKKMQAVQPLMKKIQEKYKKQRGDPKARQKMNEEVMALYRKEGVNPLGGCFPLLLQLPVLYAFYSFLPVAIELRQAPFVFWIHDLSLKDPFYVTPLVMGVSMFFQQKMTPTTTVDPTQRRMFMLMPLFFTLFFFNLPSGLVLYWLVNNILSIIQQYVINRQQTPEVEALAGRPGKRVEPSKARKQP